MLSVRPPAVNAGSPSDDPGTCAVNIVPADGKPRGIRLRAQSVNTVIWQDATGIWADTDLDVQLQNRGKEPVVVPIGIPGPQVTAFVTPTMALPQIGDVTLNGKRLELAPSPGGSARGIQASATITIPVQATADVRMRYRQAIPTREDLAAYTYPLTAGNVWAGAPESLSVAVTFDPAIVEDQLMYATANSRAPRPSTYSWSWNGAKAPGHVAVAFVRNKWWRELDAARAASSAEGAKLGELSALAERYWWLATLAPPAFAPQASFYNRYFPLALASWRSGIASAAPETPPAEVARAHERLAGLYLAQGNREGDPAAQTYLQLAVDELAAAAALNPKDEDLVASAKALQQQLATAATGRGDGMSAATHMARLTALASGQARLSTDQQAQQRALTLAQTAVASGDLADARHLLSEEFGQEALQAAGARAPKITQTILQIRSQPGRREIGVKLIGAGEGQAAQELVQETADALRRLAPVRASENGLTVTLAYSDPAALVAAQSRLAAALPAQPELALLSSALTTRRLAWPEAADLVTRTSGYEERVDLSRGMAAWNTEAQKLETAAAEAEVAGQPFDLLRSALWRADARAWRDLGALSRVTYQVELREQGAGPDWLQARVHQFYQEGTLDREWVVRAGESRQLEAAVLGWRYDRLALAAGAGLALVALVAGIVWILAR